MMENRAVVRRPRRARPLVDVPLELAGPDALGVGHAAHFRNGPLQKMEPGMHGRNGRLDWRRLMCVVRPTQASPCISGAFAPLMGTLPARLLSGGERFEVLRRVAACEGEQLRRSRVNGRGGFMWVVGGREGAGRAGALLAQALRLRPGRSHGGERGRAGR